MKKYKFLDYMSDAFIEAWGDNLEEAFINAARAFYDTMINEEKIESKETKDVEISGHDLEELLYNWIEELIYLFEVEGWLTSEYNIKIERKNGSWYLRGKLHGEKYDKSKHGSKTHIKAVTYHEMKIHISNDGVKLRYLLDL